MHDEKYLFVLVLYWFGGLSVGLQGSPHMNTLKFSITSRRNQTGHWIAQLQMEHGENDGRPIQVDFDHTTAKYDDNGSVLITVSVAAPPRRPSPDYELVPGLGYYKLHTEVKNWYEARKTCVQEGAHLAIINSEAESKALLKFWLPYPKLFDDWRNNWAYVGIHDHYKEGEFITIFDEPLNATGFSKWNPSEPNGGAGQSCVGIRRNVGTYGDIYCPDKCLFFCEQEL